MPLPRPEGSLFLMVLLYFVIHNSLIFRKMDIVWCILWPTSKYLFAFFSAFFFFKQRMADFMVRRNTLFFSLSALSTLLYSLMSVLYCHYYSNNFRKVRREIYKYNLLYWFNIGKIVLKEKSKFLKIFPVILRRAIIFPRVFFGQLN